MLGSSDPAYVLRPSSGGASVTFCVLGAARGGTSMIAGLLRMGGLFMGSSIDPATNEDRAFTAHDGNRAIFDDPFHCGRYIGKLEPTIAQRNKQHARWGWKDPAAPYYIDKLAGYLRDPHYIFVNRESYSVARGEMRAMGETDLLGKMLDVESVYERCVRWLAATDAPALVVGYEKALQNPTGLVNALSAFAGLSPEPDQYAAMVDYIAPNKADGRIPNPRSASGKNGKAETPRSRDRPANPL